MRAKYCKSKNTYTINECRNCNCPEYWKQGIGSIYGTNDNVSNIINENAERTETHTASEKTSNDGEVINIDTTRVINN